MNAQLCDPILRPFAGNVLARCDAGQLEAFAERAAVLEYSAACKPRALAEAIALLDLLRQHPSLLTGVALLQLELAGSAEWLLTTDLDFARRRLVEIGGIEIAVLNLAEVVNRQYGGLAMLTTIG